MRYEVRGLTVVARGPRGGTRFIAHYNSAATAQKVAKFLNAQEGK